MSRRRRARVTYEFLPPPRAVVRGVFWLQAGPGQPERRVQRVLATWDELDIVGRDPADPRTPIYADAAALTRGNAALERRYRDTLQALLQEAAAAPARRLRSQGVLDAMDDWMAAAADKAEGTLWYYQAMRDAWAAHVGDLPLHTLTRRHTAAFRAALETAHPTWSPYTLKTRLNPLRAFLRQAHEAGLLDRLPPVPMPRTTALPPLVPDQALLDDVLALIRARHAAAAEQVARFAAAGRARAAARADWLRWRYHLHERAFMAHDLIGLRRAEVAFLPWSHLELQAQVLTLRHVPGRFRVKADRERQIPLSDAFTRYATALRERYPDEVWYLDDATPAHAPAYPRPHALTQAFYRYLRQVRPDAKRWPKPTHGPRARHATLLRELGADPETIRKLLGHGDQASLRHYFGDDDALLRAALRKRDTVTTVLPDESPPRNKLN